MTIAPLLLGVCIAPIDVMPVAFRDPSGAQSAIATQVRYGKTTTVGLDLGDTVEGRRIHIEGLGADNLRVEQQFQTSLTVMDEGPHIDLVNWMHYTSPWKELKKTLSDSWQCAEITRREAAQFPKVTSAEIHAAVRKEGGDYWYKLVRKSKGPNDYPCAVSISKIMYRISTRSSRRWVPFGQIHFIVPMGC